MSGETRHLSIGEGYADKSGDRWRVTYKNDRDTAPTITIESGGLSVYLYVPEDNPRRVAAAINTILDIIEEIKSNATRTDGNSTPGNSK